VQAAGLRRDLGRAQQRAFRAGGELGQLLREQFLELQALRRRVAAVLEFMKRHVRRRVMQRLDGDAQRRQAGRQHLRRQHLLQRRARQAAGDHLAQVGLRQLRGGRVHRRQRRRQRCAGRHALEGGVHHLAAEEAVPDLAAHAHALSGRQGLQVRGIEIEEAQDQLGVRVVGHLHHELAPAALLHARLEHGAFDLHLLAGARAPDGRDPRLVLVAQRQVQREVDRAHEAQPLQRALRRAELRLRGGGRARGDGGIGRLVRHARDSRACRVVSWCANRANPTNRHIVVQADTSWLDSCLTITVAHPGNVTHNVLRGSPAAGPAAQHAPHCPFCPPDGCRLRREPGVRLGLGQVRQAAGRRGPYAHLRAVGTTRTSR
jgi:hypothetical protein